MDLRYRASKVPDFILSMKRKQELCTLFSQIKMQFKNLYYKCLKNTSIINLYGAA
jgi:hypothetical protein